jgi:hypothetical protein
MFHRFWHKDQRCFCSVICDQSQFPRGSSAPTSSFWSVPSRGSNPNLCLAARRCRGILPRPYKRHGKKIFCFIKPWTNCYYSFCCIVKSYPLLLMRLPFFPALRTGSVVSRGGASMGATFVAKSSGTSSTSSATWTVIMVSIFLHSFLKRCHIFKMHIGKNGWGGGIKPTSPNSGLRIWIRIQSGQWIRIRNPDPDPGGQK